MKVKTESEEMYQEALEEKKTAIMQVKQKENNVVASNDQRDL